MSVWLSTQSLEAGKRTPKPRDLLFKNTNDSTSLLTVSSEHLVHESWDSKRENATVYSLVPLNGKVLQNDQRESLLQDSFTFDQILETLWPRFNVVFLLRFLLTVFSIDPQDSDFDLLLHRFLALQLRDSFVGRKESGSYFLEGSLMFACLLELERRHHHLDHSQRNGWWFLLMILILPQVCSRHTRHERCCLQTTPESKIFDVYLNEDSLNPHDEEEPEGRHCLNDLQ